MLTGFCQGVAITTDQLYHVGKFTTVDVLCQGEAFRSTENIRQIIFAETNSSGNVADGDFSTDIFRDVGFSLGAVPVISRGYTVITYDLLGKIAQFVEQ